MPDVLLNLSVIDEPLAVCRLEPEAEIPAWATAQPFSSITRTATELSIICPACHLPDSLPCEEGWIALKLEGPLDRSLIGVIDAVAMPLAKAQISILTVTTYSTVYILVRESQLEETVDVLSSEGHWVIS